jgi:serine/threonine protein kinase
LCIFFFLTSRPGKECDIWSLGILLFFLIEMRYPYRSYYEQLKPMEKTIEIKKEIKKGLVKDGKVSFCFFNKFFFFLILIGVIITICRSGD